MKFHLFAALFFVASVTVWLFTSEDGNEGAGVTGWIGKGKVILLLTGGNKITWNNPNTPVPRRASPSYFAAS
jgi:hypothetical protein